MSTYVATWQVMDAQEKLVMEYYNAVIITM